MEIRSFCSTRPGNSHTRSLPFARAGSYVSPSPFTLPAFSPSIPRRFCSLQLIAVRPNRSSIRVNTVAIMSRPRSLLPRREYQKIRLSPLHSFCLYLLLAIGVVRWPFGSTQTHSNPSLLTAGEFPLYLLFFIVSLEYIDLALSARLSSPFFSDTPH